MIRGAACLRGFAAVAAGLVLTACERPPVVAVQTGFRGTGMEQVYNPRIVAKQAALNEAPAAAGPLNDEGPKAKDIYKNVQVLGDLSVANFNRHMASITQWVAPEAGCVYCHNVANFADDSKYTKIVARRMVQMTQKVNSGWQPHVGATGVTCYTCHRGNPVPQQVWYAPPDRRLAANSIMGDLAGQNIAARSVGYSSLPNDPFTPYLLDAKPIRVNGTDALAKSGAANNRASTKQAEHTYGLMIHMSTSLGVNCTYCHNTRNLLSWERPQRATAWYGIRMARELNNDYIVPLTSTFPANRLGPQGDIAKVNCSTCHQGAYKPLYGAQMAKDHPELWSLSPSPSAAGLPPPLSEAMRSVLYFGVGSAVLEGEQAKGLAELINTMNATPAVKVAISGYHSASGDLAFNQELAKQRAFTVRDSLLSAGIAAERVVLEKPVQAEANLQGEDPAARRVEVMAQ